MLKRVECGLPMLESVECGSSMLECVECGLPMLERVECGSPMLERVECGLPMLERVECGSPLLERVECEETIPNSNEPTSQKSESFQPHPDLLCCVRAGCQFIALFCCRYITVSVVHSRSWIRAGPKRFLAPRNVFLRHGDFFNMCRSPVKISSLQREPEKALCVSNSVPKSLSASYRGPEGTSYSSGQRSSV